MGFISHPRTTAIKYQKSRQTIVHHAPGSFTLWNFLVESLNILRKKLI